MQTATSVKERPILFSGAMVRALLDGSKTQTRRVLKRAAGPSLSVDCDDQGVAELSWLYGDGPGHEVLERIERVLCPYGAPGDRLYVRETWAQPTTLDPGPTFYRADYPACVPAGFENIPPADAITWKPSIHMPRAASRITLEVTGVRVERLQDISEDDAIAEGIDGAMCAAAVGRSPSRATLLPAAVHGYAHLWESLNAARGYGWDVNPFVWVVEFRRVKA
jgi:hypothetical protein